MKKVKIALAQMEIKDLKEEPSFDGILDDEQAFSCFNDYLESMYICDAISEIANSNVNIYNADLWDNAKINEEYIETALSEGLVDMNNFSLTKLFQAGEYEYYTAALYQNLNILGRNYMLDYLEKLEIEIDEEISNNDDLFMQFCDNFCRLLENKLSDEEINHNSTYADMEKRAEAILNEVLEEINKR